jgi:hypothetical protein
MDNHSNLINIIQTYRNNIKSLTNQHSSLPLSKEIENISKDIDNIIVTYNELNKIQNKFIKYSQGIIDSFSPNISYLTNSNSFSLTSL